MNKNILEWAKKNNYKKIKYNKKIYDRWLDRKFYKF